MFFFKPKTVKSKSINIRSYSLLLFILLVFVVDGLKSQNPFINKLKRFTESGVVKNSQIDSINKSVDSFVINQGTNENMLIQMFKIQKMAEDINYIQGQSDAFLNIARHYILTFKRPYAMKYYFEALTLCKDLNDTSRLAKIYMNIGVIYYFQKNYKSALHYYTSASLHYEHSQQIKRQSQCYYLIGISHRELNNFDSSNYSFNKGIKLKYIIKDTQGLKESYMEKAMLFVKHQLSDSALAMVNMATMFSIQTKNDHPFLSRKYNVEAQALMLKNRNEDAYKIAQMCLKEAKLNANPLHTMDAYLLCCSAALKTNDYKNAFEFQSKYLLLKDSLFSAEKAEEVSQIETNFDIKTIKNEKDLLAEKSKLHSRLNYTLLIGILLLIVVLLLLLNRYRIKHRANISITEQKNLMDKKNVEMTHSIRYAKRIQTAILPSDRLIKESLPDSFVLYKPKDIVAGDFYWMETVQLDDVLISQYADEGNNHTKRHINNQIILFAACDCTGHGVPGALVSVVCNNSLNKAVREFKLIHPGEILDKTAELVIENFSKSEEEISDGMDISLCAYNTATKVLEWAGANTPLWIVRAVNNDHLQENQYTLIEIKADKHPIGRDYNKTPFTNCQVDLEKGDTIYLFSDGFSDQFGGPTGNKKLTRKRFKDLLLSVQHLSLEEQSRALDKFIENYRKDIDQIDDILVMAVHF